MAHHINESGPSKSSHILLVDCEDEKGIVHKITGIISRCGLNIDDQAEFVEKTTNHFFMRTEVSGPVEGQALLDEVKALGLRNLIVNLNKKEQKDIIVLVSKEPYCLGDLLIRHAYDELGGRIVAVISNHRLLENLVAKFELPFHYLPHGEKPREQHEKEILGVIEQYTPAYVVLAKYMRVLSPEFVRRYPYRIINIHHSFLPAFVGANPYHQAFERGVKIIGATAHFVTEELDEGPIIAQDVIPTAHNKSPAEMVRAGRDVEKVVLAKALRLVLEDRVFVQHRHTIIFD
jgi:formyltetrahydrofolate deformylase